MKPTRKEMWDFERGIIKRYSEEFRWFRWNMNTAIIESIACVAFIIWAVFLALTQRESTTTLLIGAFLGFAAIFTYYASLYLVVIEALWAKCDGNTNEI